MVMIIIKTVVIHNLKVMTIVKRIMIVILMTLNDINLSGLMANANNNDNDDDKVDGSSGDKGLAINE